MPKVKPKDVPLSKSSTSTVCEAYPTVCMVDYANAAIDNISEQLQYLVVDINSLNHDPENARTHPENNMEAIKQSLAIYGQLKPIVVREEGRTVIAGNGTLLAAKELGWTKIAATIVSLTKVKATGYGLADNRTAELAKWDWEVVARLDALIREQGGMMVGWSSDELEVIRSAEWLPPNPDKGDSHPTSRILKFSTEQAKVLDQAIKAMKVREAQMDADVKNWSDEECLIYICRNWLGDGDYGGTDN